MSTLFIIITLVLIIFVGIVGWICRLKRVRKEEHEIEAFCSNAVQLLKGYKRNKCSQDNLTYILSHYSYISKIIPEHYPHMPVYSLGLAIRDGNGFEIEGYVNQIQSDTITSISNHERDFKTLLSEWWNVFNHFFRGIGIILRIIFGYPIQMIKPGFDFHSKGWNVFCAIIGLVGSIASVISLFVR